ncbi:MAG: hypothetical protein ACFFDT_07655 [Candidatus Hodarchaeota archaeon]
MRKNHVWIFLLLLALTGCGVSYVPLILSDSINEVVIRNFLFGMEELDLPEEEKDKLEFDILALFRSKEIYDELRDSNKLRPHEIFLDSIYRPIENGLKNELNIPIQPLKKYKYYFHPTFAGFFLYDARSVVRSGTIDATMDIDVDISFSSTQTSESSWEGVTKTRVEGKPVLNLAVEMRDRNGKVIWRDSVAIKSDRKVIIDEKWMMNTEYKQDVTGPSVVELAEQAVKLLVEKNKKL